MNIKVTEEQYNRLFREQDDSYLASEYTIGVETNSDGTHDVSPNHHIVQEESGMIEEWSPFSINGDIEDVDTIEGYFYPEEVETDDDGTEWTTDAYFELEGRGCDGETILTGEFTKEDVEVEFPDKLAEEILKYGESGQETQFRIDDIKSWSTDVDINSMTPQQVMDAAARYFKGRYGPSAYILLDGTDIWMGDHMSIGVIGDLTISKFLGLGAVRISSSGMELIKEPTPAQYSAIRSFLTGGFANDKFYVDIAQESGKNYPEHICSAKYDVQSDWRRILADIRRYFEDGIRLMMENTEMEASPSDVNLSSFKVHDRLCEKLWDGFSLDKRIRLKLLDIADDFWEYVGLSWVEPEMIVLTGSMCNYNWSDESDIDMHIIVDFSKVDDKKEFVKEYMNDKKTLWNQEHEGLNMNGIPVELYIEDIDEPAKSGGKYDLEQEKWITKPKRDSVSTPSKIDAHFIKNRSAEIMSQIEDINAIVSSTDDKHHLQIADDKAKRLSDNLKRMRQNSLEAEGESGNGNIIYKVLRRNGYLDTLWRLRTDIYDRLNSVGDELKNVHSIIHSGEVFSEGNNAEQNNPYEAKIKNDKKILKRFLMNNGKYMINVENGKDYMVYYDSTLTDCIGVNYCICASVYDRNGKLSGTVYLKPLSIFKDPDYMGNAQLAQQRQAVTRQNFVNNLDTDV